MNELQTAVRFVRRKRLAHKITYLWKITCTDPTARLKIFIG